MDGPSKPSGAGGSTLMALMAASLQGIWLIWLINQLKDNSKIPETRYRWGNCDIPVYFFVYYDKHGQISKVKKVKLSGD